LLRNELDDLYDVLGVARNAGAEDIKKAYRRLARERHPDRDSKNPYAEEEFKRLGEAYSILSDPVRRAQYDRGDIDGSGRRKRGSARPTDGKPGAGRRGPFGMGGGRRSESVKVNGTDVEYDLVISFMEAAAGAVKHVSMTNGKRLKVTIPAGTRDGALLRLKGQGIAGIGGGADGDALVSIKVLLDPTFRVEETDIHVDLSVSLPEAVLGARVDAPTIDGPVSLTVPPNSNTGTILRLKGKGLGKGAGEGRGDQYVTLKVVLPRPADPDLADFVKRKWGEKPDKAYSVRPDLKKS
jgi:DnaJ-class molecular chaperone